MHKLKAMAIKSLREGKYEDGGGLRIVVRSNGSGKWVFRFTIFGMRREMGLGTFPSVSLKDAREAEGKARALLAQGIDPVEDRRRRKEDAQARSHIFADVTRDAFESRKAELKGGGTAGHWLSPLELHILPKIGRRPISGITQLDLRDVLAPIWHEKADTARKALNRIRLVFKHAAALGIEVDLQAPDKARELLGAQKHTTRHIPSMPWTDVPEFYATLDQASPTQLAMRLLLLTGVRSFPVRNAHIDEFDGDIWTIPAVKMKGRKGKEVDFRVPLSSEAMRAIDLARPIARNGFLFPGARKGVISDMTLSQYMKRQGLEARPHGFRTSLRTWLAECTDAPHEVAEAMLAHVTDSTVVRAYRRTDFLEQRRALAERWAQHCLGSEAAVISLRRAGTSTG